MDDLRFNPLISRVDRVLIWSTLARHGKKDKNGRQEHLREFAARRSRKQRQLQQLEPIPENQIAAGPMVRETHHKSTALPRGLRFFAGLNESGDSSHRL